MVHLVGARGDLRFSDVGLRISAMHMGVWRCATGRLGRYAIDSARVAVAIVGWQALPVFGSVQVQSNGEGSCDRVLNVCGGENFFDFAFESVSIPEDPTRERS